MNFKTHGTFRTTHPGIVKKMNFKTDGISTTSHPRIISKVSKMYEIVKNKTILSTVSETSQRIQAKVTVKQLPLGRNPSSQRGKSVNLISRQDRIQEIFKQSSIIHGRPAIDPMKSLKSMPLVNSKNVTRIIVLTYFRAGSSFFGDLLQQNWKTFYHFEPLHSMTYDSRIGDEKIPDVFNLFNAVFNCNFSEVKSYLQWVRKPRNQFLFAHNLFLWSTCRSNPKICFSPTFVAAVCQRAPVHVMKVTRLHMRHLRNYLEDNPDMEIKVVYLTRDPRGIVSSRWSLDWCNGTECSDSGVLCHEMLEDIEIFDSLQEQQPSNFIKVRYEDLSLNPQLESQKLFKFLKLPFSPSVQRFLKTHTVGRRTDDKNPYSTRRNTTAMAFSWRERFTYKQVMDVQASCDRVLNKLNLSLITSPNQLPYPDGKKQSKSSLVLKNNKNEKLNENHFLRAAKYLINATAVQNSSDMSLQNFNSYLLNTNNTNIEVHKTYRILDSNLTKIDHGKNSPALQKTTVKR
ncbi:carbohydrate sulfotransferase 1-like [Stegodyphus dumicola]|uniref:carbohydrate sulfotransferase 1-like n=1 Tax=Stegodyphus dumicola TaxID=202533 RepID=UPI0015B19101|nr:carbohydrate sulfotransferase 1-like [Stegodyphus dumicola]